MTRLLAVMPSARLSLNTSRSLAQQPADIPATTTKSRLPQAQRGSYACATVRCQRSPVSRTPMRAGLPPHQGQCPQPDSMCCVEGCTDHGGTTTVNCEPHCGVGIGKTRRRRKTDDPDQHTGNPQRCPSVKALPASTIDPRTIYRMKARSIRIHAAAIGVCRLHRRLRLRLPRSGVAGRSDPRG